jgi:hypothetical protein
MTIQSGKLIGTDDAHPASGLVEVEQNVLKLVEVQISEAPDGRVILSKDYDKATGIVLGDLQSFTGSHDYPIPEGTDARGYNTVLIWCDQFNVPIGKAPLA